MRAPDRRRPARHAGAAADPSCSPSTPSGTLLLLAARDEDELFVVDARSGERRGRPVHYDASREVARAALRPDGRRLATMSRSEARAVALEGTGKEVRVPLAESGEAQAALSPDARFVASWNQDTKRLEVTSLADGKLTAHWSLDRESVTRIEFSPDGSHVAAATREGRIRVWEVDAGNRDEAGRIGLFDYPAPVEHIALNRQGTFVAVTQEGTTRVYDLRERGRRAREVARIENLPPQSVSFSSDDRSIAIVGSDMTGVWGLSPGGEVSRFTFERPVTSVTISPDKRLIAASQATAQSGGQRAGDARAGAFRSLLSLGYGTVSIREVFTGRRLDIPVKGDVGALAFAPESDSIIAAMRDGTVHAIGPLHGPGQFGSQAIAMREGRVFSCGVEAHFAGLSSDGRRLALTSATGNACVFDVATGRQILRLRSGRHVADRVVGLSRDGTWVTFVGRDDGLRMWRFGGEQSQPSPPAGNRRRRLFDEGKLDAKRLQPLFAAPAPVQSLVVSPSGSHVALTTLRRGVKVVRSLEGSIVPGISHEDFIGAFAFSADETYLVTGGEDGYARVWDLATSDDAQREVARIGHPAPVNALAFSEDQEYLVVANDREVRVVRWRSDDLVREACRRVSRPLTAAEWKAYLNEEPPMAACAGLTERSGTLLEQAGKAVSEGRFVDEGPSPGALSLYARAETAGLKPTRTAWNNLCRHGTIWGHENAVWFACERAVEEEPDNAIHRDSRGVARVLRGDRQGALEDFRFFLASKDPDIRESHRERRRRWIAALERGAYPFESGEMRELLKE